MRLQVQQVIRPTIGCIYQGEGWAGQVQVHRVGGRESQPRIGSSTLYTLEWTFSLAMQSRRFELECRYSVNLDINATFNEHRRNRVLGLYFGLYTPSGMSDAFGVVVPIARSITIVYMIYSHIG